MTLVISERTVRHKTCERCGMDYDHVTGFVDDETGTVAAYFAYDHGHPGHDAGIDAVLGTWGDDRNDDHVMFSCLLRSGEAMAVDAPVAIDPDAPATAAGGVLGRKLTRDEALGHLWLQTFWQVVDLIVHDDPTVRAAIGQAETT